MSVSSAFRGSNAEMVVFLEKRVAELEEQLDRLREDSVRTCGMLIAAAGGAIEVAPIHRVRSYTVLRQLRPWDNGAETWAVQIRDGEATK